MKINVGGESVGKKGKLLNNYLGRVVGVKARGLWIMGKYSGTNKNNIVYIAISDRLTATVVAAEIEEIILPKAQDPAHTYLLAITTPILREKFVKVLSSAHGGNCKFFFAETFESFKKKMKEIAFDCVIFDSASFWKKNRREIKKLFAVAKKENPSFFSKTITGLPDQGVVKKITGKTFLATEKRGQQSKERIPKSYFENRKWFYYNYQRLFEKYANGTWLLIFGKDDIFSSQSEKGILEYAKKKGLAPKSYFVAKLEDISVAL